MIKKIEAHFENFNFDIKKTHNGRFIDQKVTPDVLSIVADCVLNHVRNNRSAEFTSTDIWRDNYSNENVIDIFGKSDVNNPRARSEYDKFFQQPLKALSYAGILEETNKGRQIYFAIKNREILEYISFKERNSLEFLNIYLEKVLKDSNVWYLFENFFDNNTKDNFDILKSNYEEFIIKHTPINGKTEVRRIFTKIINPLAFKRRKHGTKGGHFSKDIITRDELMYNRKNWRDINKKKGETREEYDSRVNTQKDKEEAYVKYTLNKAKNIIKDTHRLTSEVSDEFSNGDATQVHHVFPQSQYPEISSFLENLILLTATQHFTQAHPNNNTSMIDKDYQLICLLAKSKSVQEYKNIYSKEDFIYVIKVGLGYDFSIDIAFTDLQNKLVQIYHE